MKFYFPNHEIEFKNYDELVKLLEINFGYSLLEIPDHITITNPYFYHSLLLCYLQEGEVNLFNLCYLFYHSNHENIRVFILDHLLKLIFKFKQEPKTWLTNTNEFIDKLMCLTDTPSSLIQLFQTYPECILQLLNIPNSEDYLESIHLHKDDYEQIPSLLEDGNNTIIQDTRPIYFMYFICFCKGVIFNKSDLFFYNYNTYK